MEELVLQTEEILVEYFSVAEVCYKLLVDITYLGREIVFFRKLLSSNGATQAEGG